MAAGCSAPLQPVTPGTAAPPKAAAPQPPAPVPKPYQVYGTWYQPLGHARGFSEQGRASWYGEQFHGRRTIRGR